MSAQNVTTAHVVLSIRGADLDPEWVTETLGILPMRAGRAGTTIREKSRTYTSTTGFWVVDRKAGKIDDLDGTARDLLGCFNRNLPGWTKVKARYDAEVTIVLYLYDANVGAFLRPETIEFIAGLGVKLDFDLYALAGARTPK